MAKKKTEEAIAALVPITHRKNFPPYVTHLTGKMLRQLREAGTVAHVEFRGPGGSFAFLEEYPRFFAQGYIQTSNDVYQCMTKSARWLDIDGPWLDIDRIIGGEKTEERPNGRLTILGHKKDFTKQEIFAFANQFHCADQFEIGRNFALAWFD